MFLIRMAIAAAVSVLSGQAQALTLDCTISPAASSRGVITERYVFDHDETTGRAVAADAVIQALYDAPISANVSDSTPKKLVLSWTVQMTNGTGQQTKMQYRASIFKAGYAITIRAVPGGGYSNSFEARGTCRKV